MPRIFTQAWGREEEKKKKAYSTPFSVMKMTKYIIHSKSAILRWIYALCITSCLLSDAGACDAYSQPARQSVVQTKWFGLAGSRGADNGRTVWLKCLWCQWLCQQLRLADPKWRSAESPAGACHGLNRGSFDPGVGWVGSFQSGGARGGKRCSKLLLRLICRHFFFCLFQGGEGGKEGGEKKEGPLGEVQIESEGPPILSSCSSKSSRSEVQMRWSGEKSPVSVLERHEEVGY